MRIDQLLNKLCLVKTRSIAKKACDKGLVKINCKTIKASTLVNDNDLIEYQIYGFINHIKIISVPKGNVSKKNALEFYEIISREKIDLDELLD